jgi:hypothetical protein
METVTAHDYASEGLVSHSQGPFVLQSEQIRVVVDPSRGAKITSLWHEESQREWLLQSEVTNLAAPAYGSPFTEATFCGWDEMLPTADACTYPREPYSGVALPDHGEVWSSPWEVDEFTSKSIVCSVRGRALPYRLRRELEVNGSTLSAHYTLSVEAPQSLCVLWAPHPQFAVEAGTHLTMPSEVEELSVSIEGIPAPMTRISVPGEGLDCTRIVPKGMGMMLYPDPDATIDWAKLTNPDGSWLQMNWGTDNVPYFAVWMDNGRYAPRPVVCPEPMTGYYDDLRRACELDRVLVIEPSKPACWSLHMTLGRS